MITHLIPIECRLAAPATVFREAKQNSSCISGYGFVLGMNKFGKRLSAIITFYLESTLWILGQLTQYTSSTSDDVDSWAVEQL